MIWCDISNKNLPGYARKSLKHQTSDINKNKKIKI